MGQITAEEIAEARRVLKAMHAAGGASQDEIDKETNEAKKRGDNELVATAEMIVCAREFLPRLLDAYEAQGKEVEQLRKIANDAISCVYSVKHTARLTAELKRIEGGE